MEALQICCLLLPPPRRRKLQLLLRMVARISGNVDMPRLHDAMGNRSLVRAGKALLKRMQMIPQPDFPPSCYLESQTGLGWEEPQSSVHSSLILVCIRAGLGWLCRFKSPHSSQDDQLKIQV